MSADFTKVLVKDDRLDVTDNIKYAVIKGGQNMTCAQFSAISESASQVTFNIQVPSEQTILDRRVLLESVLSITVQSQTLKKVGDNMEAQTLTGDETCGYGTTSALAPFPIHQLFTVLSATINNNTVSINMRDVLPVITRLMDKREVSCYNGTTPTYTDSYTNYNDGVGALNNASGNYSSALDSDIYARGSFTLLNYESSLSQDEKTLIEAFQFKITEPLLLSPFIYSNPQSNCQGFYGIQNLNFILNVGDANRVFRGPTVATIDGNPTIDSGSPVEGETLGISKILGGATFTINNKSTSFNALSSSRLLFQFLTPHPSDLMPAKNIVPYYELPRYITTLEYNNVWNGKATVATNIKNTNTFIKVNGGKRFNSQSLQLNQIPDKLIVYLRKSGGNQGPGDADVTWPISNITVNFNNNSGLLASATPQDLYKMAKDNGSNQNWLEWSGLANLCTGGPAGEQPFKSVTTVGSYLVLEFGKDIQLVEDFYAPGSLGNFNLQVLLTYDNTRTYDETIKYDLVVVTLNSGVFVNERGTSSTYTGILTKADVLEASDQVPFTRADVKRMVGGGFLDVLKSAVGKLAPVAKSVSPLANKALGSMGMGMSAGGMSAGRQHLGKHLQ